MNPFFLIITLMIVSGSTQTKEPDLADAFLSSIHQNNENSFLNLTTKSIDSLFNRFAEETLINLAENEIYSNDDTRGDEIRSDNKETKNVNRTTARSKRGTTSPVYKLDNDEYDVLNDRVGIYRLTGVYRAGRICPFNQQLLGFSTITIGSQVLSVCLTENRLVIGQIVEANPHDFLNSTIYWTGISEYRDVDFRQVDHFVKDRLIYFAIAKSGLGISLLKFDSITMQLIKLEQQTISSSPSAIKIWQPNTWKANQKSSSHLKVGQTWNLAVANTQNESNDRAYDGEMKRKRRDLNDTLLMEDDQLSNLTKKSVAIDDTTGRSISLKSSLSLFYFDTDSSYFDEYDRIHTFLVKDICTFSINNYDYMVVVNHKAGIQQHQVDSEIFKLDVHDVKWKSIKKIRTYGAVACEFFKFKTQDHPSEDEYFLVLANNHDVDENGGLIHQVNSVIYKFYYDQFIPFQCLHTFGAADVKFIKLHSGDNLELNSNFEMIKESDDYNSEKGVLAVATQLGVQLYQYNGWKFVLSSVQYSYDSMAASGYVQPNEIK